MTEALQVLCAHFVQSLGRAAEPEYFSEEDAWAAVEALAAMSARGQGLSPGALSALQNLGAALGLRPGAPASRYLTVLERHFGPCPIKPNAREQVIEYVHAQMNGQFAKARVEKVSLKPLDPVAHVPLKNYEYK